MLYMRVSFYACDLSRIKVKTNHDEDTTTSDSNKCALLFILKAIQPQVSHWWISTDTGVKAAANSTEKGIMIRRLCACKIRLETVIHMKKR